jgi:hypothetical protein
MRRREGLWDIETAKTWLRGYPWGEEFVGQLAMDTRRGCSERWVRMVMRMYTAMYSSAAIAADEAVDPFARQRINRAMEQ